MHQLHRTGRALALAVSVALHGYATAMAADMPAGLSPAPRHPVAASELSPPPLGQRREGGQTTPTDSEGRRRYILRLEEEPLATYRGDIPGLEATHPASRGQTRLQPQGPAAVHYLQWLEQRQQTHLQRMERALGRGLRVVHRLKIASNAIVAWLSDDEARLLSKQRMVRQVELDYADPISTDAGPERIHAPEVWEGLIPGITQSRGEGVVIGIIDTGINFKHPSFAATDADGYTHVNPNGAGNYLGWCNPSHPKYDPAYACNDKLIGAWDYTDASQGETDGPADGDGHGTHVASTAAGNHLPSIQLASGAAPVSISGVAPHANLIMYDVCKATCFTSDVVAAIDQAILDGVDVINESIGIGGDNFSSSKQQAYLAALEAGIVAVRAAGNDGPDPASIGSEPPWTIATAATTHGRTFENTLVDLSGGDSSPPADISGKSLSVSYGPAPIVLASQYTNSNNVLDDGLCLTTFPPGTWNGEIVVCRRGSIARVQKGANVLAGGAGGLILVDDGNGPVADNHVLPAIHVSQSDGAALEAWLASGGGHSGRITATQSVIDEDAADRVASFSSRGPDAGNIDMVKPDLAAPGVSIFAAAPPSGGQDEQYAILSGTSMASPHAAGAAALVRAVHPGWTANEVRSALMGTARVAAIKGGDDSPFDVGAGRIDVARAVRTPLVMNESFENFDNADRGNVAQLNVASLMNARCDDLCTWKRTVRNPTDRAMTYQVSYQGQGSMDASPALFTLAPGASQEITFTLDLRLGEAFDWNHGRVLIRANDSSMPRFNLPVSAFFAPGSAALQFRKSADRKTVAPNGEVTYTLSVTPAESGTHSVIDALPDGLEFVPGSASPGVTYTDASRVISWNGNLTGPMAQFTVPGSSPFGYVSLASLGVQPFQKPSDADEGGLILTGLDFVYDGQPVTDVLWSVNGTVEAGTASGVSASYLNTQLPDPGAPNALLAPFWSDLDMSSSGNWYVADLNAGSTTYTVFEWENVPAWNKPGTSFTFQIWIQKGTSNIWFVYHTMDYQADDMSLVNAATVGFENRLGTTGFTRYFGDGIGGPSGTLPATGDDYKVELSPATGTEISFRAKAIGNVGDVIVNEAVLVAPSGGQRAAASVGIGNILFQDGFENGLD